MRVWSPWPVGQLLHQMAGTKDRHLSSSGVYNNAVMQSTEWELPLGSVHCALDVTGTFTSPRSALTASSYTGATTHYANSIVHPRQQRADHNWHLDNIPMANSHTYSAPIVDQSIALLFPIIEVFCVLWLKAKGCPCSILFCKVIHNRYATSNALQCITLSIPMHYIVDAQSWKL